MEKKITDEQFKINVSRDLGYIKAKLENFDRIIVPCEKHNIKASLKTNRTMIFSLYGVFGVLLIGLIIKAVSA